jgi:hypothetical protein
VKLLYSGVRRFQGHVQRTVRTRLQLQQRRATAVEVVEYERESVESTSEHPIGIFGIKKMGDCIVFLPLNN